MLFKAFSSRQIEEEHTSQPVTQDGNMTSDLQHFKRISDSKTTKTKRMKSIRPDPGSSTTSEVFLSSKRILFFYHFGLDKISHHKNRPRNQISGGREKIKLFEFERSQTAVPVVWRLGVGVGQRLIPSLSPPPG